MTVTIGVWHVSCKRYERKAVGCIWEWDLMVMEDRLSVDRESSGGLKREKEVEAEADRR